MKTGQATLPLHGGQCPAWLFKHMKTLGSAIVEVIVEDFGAEEVLKRLSNPYWFQALGCLLGFDWHSSGLTTTVCGALKAGLQEIGPGAGIFFTGGKGRTARNTPLEIQTLAEKYSLKCNPDELIFSSKMSAKIDNAAVQDSYQIYHHCFIFLSSGSWAVIQQGMNTNTRMARRYHWLGSTINDFCCEPHTAICCDQTSETLNMVSEENKSLRTMSCSIARDIPLTTLSEIESIQNTIPELQLPCYHPIPRTSYLNKALYAAYEAQPENFEQLLNITGVGPSTLRALCLVAEIAYGAQASFQDPCKYSFAHGGKDGFPFPVNEQDMHHSYLTLKRALKKAKLGQRESLNALKRLSQWYQYSSEPIATPFSPPLDNLHFAKRSGIQSPPILKQPKLFY